LSLCTGRRSSGEKKPGRRPWSIPGSRRAERCSRCSMTSFHRSSGPWNHGVGCTGCTRRPGRSRCRKPAAPECTCGSGSGCGGCGIGHPAPG